MSYEDGFRTGLAGLAYVNNQFQAGQDRKRQDEQMQYDRSRQQEGDQMVRQKFGYEQDDREKQEIGDIAGYLSSIQDPQQRQQTYMSPQVQAKLRAFSQRHGLPLPDVLDDAHLPEMRQLAQAWGSGGRQSELPADVQTMQWYMAHPEAYAKAKELRQASANPYGFEWQADATGKPQLVRTNKREGTADIAAVPNAPSIAPTPLPEGKGPMTYGQAIDTVQRIEASEGPIPPSQRKQMIQELMTGRGMAVDVPTFAPRSKEAEAAAVENAKIGAQVGNTAAVADSEAAIAAAKAKAEVEAKAQGESAVGLSGKLNSAQQLIDVLDKAIKHPGRAAATGLSSKLDPRNKIAGTDAYNFNVLAEQINGKAFLEAFNSLRGGGAITEREGAAATAAIARLNTAQSESEYLAAMNELKNIAFIGMQRERIKAGKGGNPAHAGFRVLD